jgi:hypothetical protein
MQVEPADWKCGDGRPGADSFVNPSVCTLIVVKYCTAWSSVAAEALGCGFPLNLHV